MEYRIFAAIWSLLHPYKWVVGGAVFSLFIAASTILSLGSALKYLIDQGLASNNTALLGSSIYILLGASITLALAAFCRTSLTAWLGEKVLADLKIKIFSHILIFDRSLLEQQKTGDLLACLNGDTQQLLTFISNSAAVAFRSLMQLMGGTALLIMASPKLTAIAFLIIPLIILPISILGRHVRRLSREVQASQGQQQSFSEEVIVALLDVQLFQKEQSVLTQFEEHLRKSWSFLKKRLLIRSLLISTVIFLAFSAISSVIWIGGRDVVSGHLSPGTFSSFIFYAVVVAGSLNQVAELVGDFQAAGGAFDRITELLNLSPKIIAPISIEEKEMVAPQQIILQNVTFYYPSQPSNPTLHDLSLTLERGQKIAVVGPSGAGKTTLFHLLTRLYDPQEGEIVVDGQLLREMPLMKVRGLFSIVPQDPVIFNATILENIAFGAQAATTDEIMRAAQAAYVDEFVRHLPSGFDTIVGERGIKLSGGQRQRLAIARAFLRRAPIVLLDEATNALDATSEALIQQALAIMTQERTALIIAHRLSTILKADQIIVLEKGRIVQKGTHSSLIAQSGLYRTLAEKQYFTSQSS